MVTSKGLVISCSTQEQWNAVIDFFKLEDMKKTSWKNFHIDSCIYVEENVYADVPYATSHGYKVTPFEEFFTSVHELW